MPNKKVIVIIENCDRCGTCIAMCPQNAIEMTSDSPVINASRCRLCSTCVKTCAMGALSICDIQDTSAG